MLLLYLPAQDLKPRKLKHGFKYWFDYFIEFVCFDIYHFDICLFLKLIKLHDIILSNSLPAARTFNILQMFNQ